MLYYLMNNNTPVLAYDMEEQYMVVLNNEMLPYELKDFVQTTRYDSKESMKKTVSDMDALKDFFRGRVLNISRTNAKAILGAATLPQTLNTESLLKITEACRGLSVNDNFWIKKEVEQLRFEDIDIRRNPLSNAAYEVAILGRPISATAEALRPELVTDGMFAKVWKRNGGVLELWKTDKTNSFVNTEAEILVSNILDNSNVKHIRYERKMQDGVVFAVSKCASNEHLSHISAQSVKDWCRHQGVDFLSFVEEHFPGDFHRMVFTDYIIANTDRHEANWWFEVDANINQIVGLGALMDHNQALIADMFGTDIRDLVYEPTGLTFEETARKYAKYAGEINIDEDVLPEACRRRYNHIKALQNIQTQEKKNVRNRGEIPCFDVVEESETRSTKRPSEADSDDEPDVYDILNACANDSLGMGEKDYLKAKPADLPEVLDEGFNHESL